MVDLETKSVKKLVVKLLAMVDLGFCSTAILMSLTIFFSLRRSWAYRSRGFSGVPARSRRA